MQTDVTAVLKRTLSPDPSLTIRFFYHNFLITKKFPFSCKSFLQLFYLNFDFVVFPNDLMLETDWILITGY